MARDLRLQVLLSTVDKITGPLKKVMNGGRATDKALSELNARLGVLRRSQDELDEFGSLQTGLKKLTPALAAAQAKTAELARQIKGTDEPSKKLVRSFERAKAEAKRLKDEFQGNSQRLHILRDRLGAAGVSTDRLENEQNALRLKINATNQSIARQKQQMEQLAAATRKAQERAERFKNAGMNMAAHGAGAFVLGQGMMPAATAPMAAFMEQDSAASLLRATLTGADGKVAADYAEIEALASRLGNQLPGTTAELTAMMDALARAGIDTKAILGGVGEAAALLKARIGDELSYVQSAQIMAKLSQATRTVEGDMVALADTIQRSAGLNVRPEEMLAGFSKLSPVLDVLKTEGLEATDALAPLLTAAIGSGMAGESAGNAIRKVLQLSLDSGRVEKANEALKGSGMALDFTDGSGEFGGFDQMFAQLAQLRSLDTVSRLEVLKKLYGDDAETLQIASQLISSGADGYAEVQRRMAAQGSLQQRVTAQLDSLPAKWESATGTLQNTLGRLGEAMAPMLIPLIDAFTNLLEKIQWFIDTFPTLSGVIGVVIAGFAGLLVVVGAIITPLAVIVSAVGHALPLLATFGGWMAGMGPVLAGLAKNALPMLGMALRAVGAALMANPIGIALGLLATAGYLIWQNWDGIKGGLIILWEQISAGVIAAWEWLKPIFAWTPLGMIVNNWGAIMAFFETLWERFKTIGANLLQGLVQGLLGGLAAVRTTIGNVADSVVGWLKEKLGIHSPSRVFAELGGFTVSGFAQGLDAARREPVEAMRRVAGAVTAAGAAMAVGAAGSALAIDNRPALAGRSPAAASGGGLSIGAIHIHAGAGVDAQAIAKAVRDEIERLDRERGARRRSSLSDIDP